MIDITLHFYVCYNTSHVKVLLFTFKDVSVVASVIIPSLKLASSGTTAIQSLAEIQLKITEKDIKEYFNITGRIDEPRFNAVALFYADWNDDQQDYENVRLFSKLYIPTENVSLSKDLDLIYRVYEA